MKTCNKCNYTGNNFSPGRGSVCRTCKNEYHRSRYSNPELRRKSLESVARWRARNPDAEHERRLKRLFNITLDEYNDLFDRQGGLCAICRQPETVRRMKKGDGPERLAVDHCHDTGRIRGLLCFKCNTAIGSLGDTQEHVNRAINYLQGVSV